jgi:hypothetical protein
VFALGLALAACTSDETPPPPPTPTAEHTHAEGHHHAEGDGHAARHGGQQRELKGLHVEALFEADGVHFYLGDGDNNPLSPEGSTGDAVITGPAGVETASLMAMGDALHAPAKLETGKPASAVLTLTRGGETQSASFETAAVGTAFHDHAALHGGQVGMWGHYHVELLAKDDVYSVWVTDAGRSPVTTATTGVVVDGSQRLALTVDPTSGGLTAKAEGAGTRPVTVEITVEDQNISLPFQAGTATGDGHADHTH